MRPRLHVQAQYELTQFVNSRLASGDLPTNAQPILNRREFRLLRRHVAEYAQNNGAAFALEGTTATFGHGQFIQWLATHWQTIYSIVQAILAMFGVVLPPINIPSGTTTTLVGPVHATMGPVGLSTPTWLIPLTEQVAAQALQILLPKLEEMVKGWIAQHTGK